MFGSKEGTDPATLIKAVLQEATAKSSGNPQNHVNTPQESADSSGNSSAPCHKGKYEDGVGHIENLDIDTHVGEAGDPA